MRKVGMLLQITWACLLLCVCNALLPAVGDFAPRPSDSTLSAQLPSLARQVESVLSTEINNAKAFVADALAADKKFFESGVDRAVNSAVRATESFSNHLATSEEALRIAEQGELFLRTSNDTAARLAVPVSDLETATEAVPIRLTLKPFCPFGATINCASASNSRYRTIDGSCNNVANPYWGKAFTPFQRFLPPTYDDGAGSPRTKSVLNGFPLPGARTISFSFHEQSTLAHLMTDISHMSMEFGQFISHDIQRNALSKGYLGSNLDCCASRFRRSCFPIDLPANDPYYSQFGRTCMNFVRAVPTPNLQCSLANRQQLNQNTHYLDASQVYGSDKKTSDSLRTFVGGKMKTDSAPGINNLLPKDVNNNANCILPPGNPHVKCFKAGDVRANQQPALITLHTIFMREHNHIASKLAAMNPSWSDQTLYDESRKIVGAILQHITYKEYLPDIVGGSFMTSEGLKPQTAGYFTGYNATQNGAIYNGFSAAAFRFGHSQVRDRMANIGGSTPNPLLKDVFLNPSGLYDTSGGTTGIDGFAKGLTGNYAQKIDRRVSTQLSNHLFERQPGFGGDLPAINIQRGRDHGIPFYLIWKAFCGKPGLTDHDPAVLAKLMSVYGHPADIDLFTGGVSERPVPGGKVGHTFACIIAKQFNKLKKHDRYYYENSGPQSFELGQLNEIRKQTMAKVMCRNTGIAALQKNVFLKDITVSNPQQSCSSQPDIDFGQWRCAGWLPWGPFTNCFGGFKIRLRSCWSQNPRPCTPNANPCPGSAFELVFCGGFRLFDFSFKEELEEEIRGQLSSRAAAKLAPSDILKTAVVDVQQRVVLPIEPIRERELPRFPGPVLPSQRHAF